MTLEFDDRRGAAGLLAALRGVDSDLKGTISMEDAVETALGAKLLSMTRRSTFFKYERVVTKEY